MRTSKELFETYFENKSAFDDLQKATYAYHFKGRDDIHAHSFHENLKSLNLNFASDNKKFQNERCEWCEQSREEIRWGGDPRCKSRPLLANRSISETLLDEETSYLLLIERGKDVLPELIRKKFQGNLSAQVLFYAQTTLGYEPDVFSAIMDIDTEPFMVEYEMLMNVHRTKS